MKKETKGMIMAFDKAYATVLTADGQFLKVKKPSEPCFIGDEIAFTQQTGSLAEAVSQAVAALRRPILQGAVAMSALIFAGLGSWAYPVGHVYMDVNPSIGLTYNVYHRVIGAESYNEDGQNVVSAISVYGKTLEDSVAESLRVMDEQGYVKSGEAEVSGVILGYSDEAVETEAVAGISKAAEAAAKPVTVATVKVSDQAAKTAKASAKEPVKTTPIKVTLASGGQNQDVKQFDKQSTAEIIQSNRKALKVIQDERLEKIKKMIEQRKQKQKEQKDQPKVQEQPKKEQEKPKAQEQPKEQEKPNVQEQPKNPGQDNRPADETKSKDEEDSDQADKRARLEVEIQRLEKAIEALLQSELPPKEKAKRIKQVEKQLERLEKLKERIK